MTSRKISKKAAAFGVAAVIGIGGGAAGVAYAYPSGFPLTVSATATQATNGTSTVSFTIGNNDPRCDTLVTVAGTSQVLPAGTSTGTATIPAGSGRQRVRARTIDCDLRERADADFVVPNAAISGPTSGSAGDRFRYELSGLQPGTTVTVTALQSGAGTTYSDTDTVNRSGEATVRLRIRVAGTYAVSATVAGSVVASTSITVS